jgi:hypothetical protein
MKSWLDTGVRPAGASFFPPGPLQLFDLAFAPGAWIF